MLSQQIFRPLHQFLCPAPVLLRLLFLTLVILMYTPADSDDPGYGQKHYQQRQMLFHPPIFGIRYHLFSHTSQHAAAAQPSPWLLSHPNG